MHRPDGKFNECPRLCLPRSEIFEIVTDKVVGGYFFRLEFRTPHPPTHTHSKQEIEREEKLIPGQNRIVHSSAKRERGKRNRLVPRMGNRTQSSTCRARKKRSKISHSKRASEKKEYTGGVYQAEKNKASRTRSAKEKRN